MHIRLKPLAALLLPLFAVNTQTLAQQSLDPVVVTATRTESRVSEVLADVTVIDREEIERSAGGTVVDLLTRQPGVQVTTMGGAGTGASLYLRGAKPDQTKILIDGLPINSIDGSGSPLRFIPLANVERIEILRGPASTLYGADAVGGVIQIFTRKGSPGLKFDGFAGYGSQSTFQSSAGVSGGNEQWRFRAEGSHDTSKSIDAMRNTVGKNRDRDAYRNSGGALSLSFLPVTGHEIGGSYRQNEGRAHYDDTDFGTTYDAYNDFRTKQWQLFSRNKLTDFWTSKLQYGKTLDWQKNFSSWPGVFETENTLLSWQNDFSLPLGKAVLGAERLKQEAWAKGGFEGDARTNSVFAAWNANLNDHRWSVSGRHDDHSEWGGQNTWGLAYGYQLSKTLNAHASYGTSFKAPRLDELYYPAWGGNPALKPEKGRNKEVGLTWDNGAHLVSATYYRNDVKDLITYVSLPGPPLGINENVAKARLEGVTFAYAGRVGDYRFKAGYDWLNAKNRDTGDRLGRRAKNKATAEVSRVWGPLEAGIEWVGVGSRYDQHNETGRLGGYSLINLTGRYAINKNLSIEGRVNNLFDKDYELAQGYNTPGLNAFIGIRYTPQ